jgi:hypothetical protein
VEAVAPVDAAKDTWRVKALVATAMLTVREIQVLHAPHIADPDDAVMTRMEQRMATSEVAARSAIQTLAPLVQPASRPQLAAATAALDRFLERQRSDHGPLPPEHQCAFSRAVPEPEREGHRGLRGEPACAPRRSGQAWVHRYPISSHQRAAVSGDRRTMRHRTRFRLYSFATVATVIVFGAWAGILARPMPGPTSWLGLAERVNIYATMLWVAVLAVCFLRVQDRAGIRPIATTSAGWGAREADTRKTVVGTAGSKPT